MTPQDKRENRLRLLDDDIGRALQDSIARGELRSAPSWGKPLRFGDGYDETPDALKMPFKVLKDAGYAPPEVELMREIADAQAALDAAGGGSREQQQRLAEMRQRLALRMEGLRRNGAL